MLQVTSNAAATLADARSQIGLPGHFGVRIFRGVTPEAKSVFEFDFVEEPQEGDQVGKTEDTRFFVAPEVAEPLAHALLDAEETDQGRQLVLKRLV
jgi:Fe-S cluster assembly iron-binding protein IscA